MLGHKEVHITPDRYSHALPTLQAEAMGRLDVLLGRAQKRSGFDKRSAGASRTGKRPDSRVNPAFASLWYCIPDSTWAAAGVPCVSTWGTNRPFVRAVGVAL